MFWSKRQIESIRLRLFGETLGWSTVVRLLPIGKWLQSFLSKLIYTLPFERRAELRLSKIVSQEFSAAVRDTATPHRKRRIMKLLQSVLRPNWPSLFEMRIFKLTTFLAAKNASSSFPASNHPANCRTLNLPTDVYCDDYVATGGRPQLAAIAIRSVLSTHGYQLLSSWWYRIDAIKWMVNWEHSALSPIAISSGKCWRVREEATISNGGDAVKHSPLIKLQFKNNLSQIIWP